MSRAPLATVLLGSALLGGTSFAQQTINDFNDLSGGNVFFAGGWEASGSISGTTSPATSFVQGSGVFDVTGPGVTNDAGSYLEFHFSIAPLDLSDATAVSLNATALAGNEATSVEIRLFDTAGASAFAAIELASLPAAATWVADSGFDASAVEIVRLSGGQLDGTAALALRLDELATVSAVASSFHDGDYDRDQSFSLPELLRVIELYNTRNGTTRTGRYVIAAETVDGFAPDSGTAGGTTPNLSRYHSADVDRDAQFSLSELLRVIELYNTRSGTTRTGLYHRDPNTEDGFASGPAPTSGD